MSWTGNSRTCQDTARPFLCPHVSFSAPDVAAFVSYRADPDVDCYQSWGDFTLERGPAFVEALRRAAPGVPGEWFQFALDEKASGALVGELALRVDAEGPRQAEVGFTLSLAQQGKG